MNTMSIWVSRTLVIFVALVIMGIYPPYGTMATAGILALLTPPPRR